MTLILCGGVFTAEFANDGGKVFRIDACTTHVFECIVVCSRFISTRVAGLHHEHGYRHNDVTECRHVSECNGNDHGDGRCTQHPLHTVALFHMPDFMKQDGFQFTGFCHSDKRVGDNDFTSG